MNISETDTKKSQELSRLEWLVQFCGTLLLVFLTLFAISA